MKNCKYNNYLMFLPSIKQIGKKDFLGELKKSIETLKENPYFEKQIRIANLVFDKCSGAEEDSWDRELYFQFIKNVFLLSNIQLEIVESSLIKCITFPKQEIAENLSFIAQQVDFYPEVDRKYNSITRQYEILPKEIKKMDCCLLLHRISAQMLSFVCSEAERFIASLDDFEILYTSLSEIAKNGPMEKKIELLKAFDQNFSYLKDSTLYIDIYQEFRSRYFSLLLYQITKVYNLKCRKEYGRISEAYYTYKDDAMLSHAHVKSAREKYRMCNKRRP